MYRPEPLPLSIWIVNPFDDIPGEGLPPLRYWSLARVLAGRGHDVTWWTAAWSHRRKAPRATPLPAPTWNCSGRSHWDCPLRVL